MYVIGDRIIVTQSFHCDGIKFSPGDSGTIIDLIGGSWMCIQWDFEHAKFHNHDGKGAKSHCWTIGREQGGIVLEEVYSRNGNPLPEDPRLRSIALKILDLERAFKQRQEAKKKSVSITVPATLRTGGINVGATGNYWTTSTTTTVGTIRGNW